MLLIRFLLHLIRIILTKTLQLVTKMFYSFRTPYLSLMNIKVLIPILFVYICCLFVRHRGLFRQRPRAGAHSSQTPLYVSSNTIE